MANMGFHKNVVAHAVVGGIASVAGGGKFADGAVTAAFGYLFNYRAHCEAGDTRCSRGALPTEGGGGGGAAIGVGAAVGTGAALSGDTRPDSNGGYAYIWNDGSAHMSIEVRMGEDVLHTELLGQPGEITEVGIATNPGRPFAGPIPLPNARGALEFSRSMLGQEYGPYDIRQNSCYTYCGDVLRAGGVPVGPESRGFSNAIKPYMR